VLAGGSRWSDGWWCGASRRTGRKSGSRSEWRTVRLASVLARDEEMVARADPGLHAAVRRLGVPLGDRGRPVHLHVVLAGAPWSERLSVARNAARPPAPPFQRDVLVRAATVRRSSDR